MAQRDAHPDFPNHAPGTIPRWAIEAEPDPLERLRMRFGYHPSFGNSAAREAHPALVSVFFQPEPREGVAILELWFRPGTERAEQSAATRAAYEALRAWYPDLESWDVRARPGREARDARKGYLGRRDGELELLARARAKRLRGQR